MRFLHPNYLFILIPILMMLLFSFMKIRRQRKALKRFGDTELVKELMPDLSLRRKLTKDIILVCALSLLVLALARPQLGSKSEKVELEGVELMVCMDISNSMLSQDIEPSRLDRAKAIVSRMVDKLANNKIGLIYFAGEAYIQLPVTADFVSAKMFLNEASPELISDQGTVIGQAVELAIRSFSKDNKTKRAIIIITDGENHEGETMEAVARAKKEGILVNVIGLGSKEGGPIPLPEGGYLTDESGQMVVTKLNEAMCKEIAQASGGVYIHASDVAGTVRSIEKSLDSLEKTKIEATRYAAYNEVYHYFLIPALMLLLFDFIFLDRKNRYLRRMKLFD